MDDRRFDNLTRLIGRGASRRTLIKGLLGLTGTVAAGATLEDDASSRTTGSRPRIPTPPPYNPPPECPDGQSMCNGSCCANGQCNGGACCDAGTIACGGAGCCDAGLACCHDQNGNPKSCCAGSCTLIGSCCPAGNTPCGGDCCSPDQACCGGECCPSGYQCIGDELCCLLQTCPSLGVACGTRPDGCGGTLSCGDCDDGSLCTIDSCDEASGQCVFTPVDCPEGELCSESTGECVCLDGFERCGGSGPCLASLGTFCSDAEECCSGLCLNDQCSEPGGVGSSCGSTDECAPSLGCCGNVCRDVLNDPGFCGDACSTCDDGNACTVNGCLEGACTFTNLVDGTTCGGSSSCCGGTCIADCEAAAHEVCDPSSQACVCDAASGYIDCAGVCRLDLGESCSADAECCSNACHEGLCTDQCAGGGQTCATDDECCSGACYDGSCVACGQDGTPCDSDPDCCAGFTCYEGSCVTFGTQCDGDADCDPGHSCCGTACIDTQIDPQHCGACDDPCDPNFDCIGGECVCTAGVLCGDACLDGTCCPEDAACSDTQPCCDGFHCCDTNICTECCENTDCAEGEFCDNGTCATGCNDDPGCAHLNTECQTFTCDTGSHACEPENVTDRTTCSTGVCCGGECVECCETEDCPAPNECQVSVACNANVCEYENDPDGFVCGQPGVGLCCSGECRIGIECCDTEAQSPQCLNNCSCNGGNCFCPFRVCNDIDDCSFGLRCCDAVGERFGTCVECCGDGQCPAGERCELGECIACTSNGQTCGSPDECCSGSCVGDVCVATCAAVGESCSSETCCAGLICHTTGECVECTPESDSCPFGFTCDAEMLSCVQDDCVGPGETCSDDVDCCEWSCLSGRCLDRCVEEDGFCDSDADCCNERLCIDDVCAEPRNDGDPCEVGLHCESGKCCEGICASPFDAAHCTGCNAPCGIDEICCDNVCRSGDCCFENDEDEAHCPLPQLCSNFACECPVDNVEIVLCNGVCTHILFDPQHCGGCNSLCTDPDRTACDEGICVCPDEDGPPTPCTLDDECCDFCYENECRTASDCLRDGDPCTDDGEFVCCGACYIGQCVARPQFGEPCREEFGCGRNLECNFITGLCGREDGNLCATDAECASNDCVEGVCCGSRCSGPCESCLAANTLWCRDGECCPLPIGSHTDACAEEDDKVCIAGGQCACVADGELFCDGNCATAVCCNENQFCGEDDECCGDLTCIMGVCAPKSGLFGPCDSTLDCSHEGGVMLCTGDDLSHPFPSACLYDLGAPCTPDAVEACDSQICVDGVCCRDLCEEPCFTCDILVHGQWPVIGICLPVAEGLDPADECPGDMVCNGDGACMQPA